MEEERKEPGEEEPQELPRRYRSAREEIRYELREVSGAGTLFGRGMKLPVVLTREECRQLMVAYTKGKWAFRNNLVTRCLYVTGVRGDELASLQFCDISYGSKTLFIRAGKGEKDRYVVADEETFAPLRTWQEGKSLADSLFVSVDDNREIGAAPIIGAAFSWAGGDSCREIRRGESEDYI